MNTKNKGWRGGVDSGKAFEAEFGSALKDVDTCWACNSNDSKCVNDFRWCWQGISCLAELKKTATDRLHFSAVNSTQSKYLQSHALAGGLSVVAIKRTFPNRSRVWLVRWQDWLTLKGTHRSLLLDDARRPTMLHELGRIDTEHSGRVWDVTPFLDEWLIDVFLPRLKIERVA